MRELIITERGRRESCLGSVRQIKVFSLTYRPLSWSEVWEAFAEAYPGRWAVQCFPPAGVLVAGKPAYHRFVCDAPPAGVNIR